MMVLFGSMFGLTLVGLILYLYATDTLSTAHLRPFQFAKYILVFVCAMSVGLELIRAFSDGRDRLVSDL